MLPFIPDGSPPGVVTPEMEAAQSDGAGPRDPVLLDTSPRDPQADLSTPPRTVIAPAEPLDFVEYLQVPDQLQRDTPFSTTVRPVLKAETRETVSPPGPMGSRQTDGALTPEGTATTAPDANARHVPSFVLAFLIVQRYLDSPLGHMLRAIQPRPAKTTKGTRKATPMKRPSRRCDHSHQ